MSNPRNVRFYDGLNYHGTTFALDGSITFTQVPAFGTNHSPQIGMAVALVGDQLAGLGVTGNPLLGKLETVEADANGAVQDQGYMTLSYPANDGTVPVLNGPVKVNGAGMVIAAASGDNKVVSINTAALTCVVEVLG